MRSSSVHAMRGRHAARILTPTDTTERRVSEPPKGGRARPPAHTTDSAEPGAHQPAATGLDDLLAKRGL